MATHQSLPALVEQRRFRADLFYRLQVLTLTMPPLRERLDELPALARLLLPRGARLSPRAMQALLAYAWPGNIRELKNTLWRASILAEGAEIDPAQLGLGPALPGTGGGKAATGALAAAAGEPAANAEPAASATESGAAVPTLAETEARAIAAALEQTGGNRTRAAALLGIARSTLQEKLRRAQGD